MANANFAQKGAKAVGRPIFICTALAFEKAEIMRNSKKRRNIIICSLRDRENVARMALKSSFEAFKASSGNSQNSRKERVMMNSDITNAMRELSAEEIGDVGGGATNITYLTYIRRIIWQVQNAPANSTLVECSDDMTYCGFQSN